MSDPKIAASFGGTFSLNDNSNKMLLPSLPPTTDDPLRNAPKLLVPPTPRRRSSATPVQRSPSGSITEQIDTVRRTTFIPAPPPPKPSVDEITEILRERRQKMRGKKPS
jgi:hypothetical protein